MNKCPICGIEYEGDLCPDCSVKEETGTENTESATEAQSTDTASEKKPNGFKRFMSKIGSGIVKGFKATMSFLNGKVISSIVYALPYFAFILFNVLVWMFFSAPIRKFFGESGGSFFDYAFGNSIEGEAVLGFGFIFTIAVLTTLISLFMAFMLAIPNLRKAPIRWFGEHVSLASIFRKFTVLFYAVYMLFGILISSYSKLATDGEIIARGACGPLFTIFSIVFLVHVCIALLASWYNEKYNSSKPEISKLFDDMNEPKIKPEKPEEVKAEPKEPVPVPELEEIPNYDIPKSKFNGGAFANFFINVLVVFVTIVSLTLALPGILCWKQRWITRHTTYDNRQLVFDGRGIQLFGKCMLWGLLTIITLGFYATFLLPAAIERWKTKHTHFADTPAPAEGVEGPKSKFDGGAFGLWGVSFVAMFLSTITLGIASFWAHCWKERWLAKHRVIDNERLYFNGTGFQYFGKKIVWLLLTVVTFGIYAFWLVVKQMNWTASHTHLDSVKDDIEAKEAEIKAIKARNKAKIKAAKAQAKAEGRPYAGDSFERDSKAGFIMSIIAVALAGIFAIASIITGGTQAVLVFAILEVKIFSGIALAFSIREKSVIGVILSAIAVMIV